MCLLVAQPGLNRVGRDPYNRPGHHRGDRPCPMGIVARYLSHGTAAAPCRTRHRGPIGGAYTTAPHFRRHGSTANAIPMVVRKRRSAAEKVCQTPSNQNVPCDTPPTVPDALISSTEGTRSWLSHRDLPRPLFSLV
jgi:hypothetical protein